MKRDELADLLAFLAVAEVCNFTRAAAQAGTSQAALSFAVQRLETRLGVRLLQRTTRRVSLTEAGERLMATARPNLAEIAEEMAALREGPAGRVRITSCVTGAETILWPRLSGLMRDHPALQVELSIDSRLVDLVAEKFDAGVRLGESLAADMIALRISPDLRMVTVAAPDYLARHGAPAVPRDLMAHRCITLRLPTLGGVYPWELAGMTLRLEGRLTVNTPHMAQLAAREGHGLAFLFEEQVRADLASGALVEVLKDWAPTIPGLHLYHPSRRQMPPALALVIETLRWRAK